MGRPIHLRGQAKVLRTLADSFDIAAIREELLYLATRCEALALLADQGNDRLTEPIDPSARPKTFR